MKIFNKQSALDLLALLAGPLLTLSFAPYDIFPFAVIAPAFLLVSWLSATPDRSFLRGFLFGIGFFGTGVYWVYNSIYTYGNAPWWLAAIITITFIAILSLFPATNGYLLNRYFPKATKTKLFCAFPAIWVFLEWIRSWFFSGFPWLFLGTSQWNTPLKGFAPILSVYGVSLAVVLSSALLVLLFSHLKQKQFKLAGYYFLSFSILWAAGFCLSLISWTKPYQKPIQVSLVQGNIPESTKWNDDIVTPTLEHYLKLSEPHWNSKIIIWPESAIPISKQSAAEFIASLDKYAKDHNAAVITGIPIEATEKKDAYYNAVISMGTGSGEYLKQRLVPFGEFVPFAAFFQKVLNVFNIPMSNFIPDLNPGSLLTVGGINIATFICYEIAFPEQVLKQQSNVHVILTLSNDGWFGDSIAPAQHIEIAKMRALEMGRPVLFVSNTGITAIIDSFGKMKSSIPIFQSAVLTDTVQPMFGKTPWQRFAMDPILLILLVMLGFEITTQRKHKR